MHPKATKLPPTRALPPVVGERASPHADQHSVVSNIYTFANLKTKNKVFCCNLSLHGCSH